VRGMQAAGAHTVPLFGTASDTETRQQLDMLRSEVQSLQQEKNDLLRQLLSGEISADQIRQEMETAKNAAGLLPVEGPGIRVTLGDSEAASSSPLVERGMVHDYDLLFVINELRAAGAEAISIGAGRLEERITGSTYVRCTGPTVVVNNTRLTVPFVIEAIGDPEVLEQSLNMPGGVLEQLRLYGLSVKLEKSEKLKLPGYTLPLKYRFIDDAADSGGSSEPPPAAESPAPLKQPDAIDVKHGGSK
jgi:uncharacterized protein YlxW (UPF0749 family)